MLDSNIHHIDFAAVKFVAFDLFNTLVHITGPQKAHKELFTSLSLSQDQQRQVKKNFLTQDTTDIFTAFPVQYHKKLSLLVDDFKFKIQAEVESTILYQDSLTTLKALSKKHPIYLVSNLATPYKKVVSQLGIEQYFSKMLFSCDLGMAKPSKGIFELLGEPSKEILMIGDSYHSDFIGSQNAGLESIILKRNKFDLTPTAPYVGSLATLVRLLA